MKYPHWPGQMKFKEFNGHVFNDLVTGYFVTTAISNRLFTAKVTVAFEAGHRYFVTTIHLHVAGRIVLCLDNGTTQCPDVGMAVYLTT